MKNFLALGFLFCFCFLGVRHLSAQVVTIPDVNFRNTLLNSNCAQLNNGTVWQTVDTNQDGNIQVAEALAVTSLNLNQHNISDMTGIQSFLNLQQLLCHNNQLTSLDVSNLTNLINLYCHANQLTSLDVSNLTNLSGLFCHANQLTSLDVSNLTNLTQLSCGNNQLTSLDISNLAYLTGLNCNSNQLSSLDVSNSTNLIGLDCGNNQLTSLDVSNLTNLSNLDCNNNQLMSLDVSNLTNLIYLFCYDNQLSSLDVSNLVNLIDLRCYSNTLTILDVSNAANIALLMCYNNQLTTLDVSSVADLGELVCYNNQLTTLTVSNLANLDYLYCGNNQLTSLYASNLPNLAMLSCSGNQLTTLDLTNLNNNVQTWLYIHCGDNQLKSLLLKNVSTNPEVRVNFPNNPLQYICIDTFRIAQIYDSLQSYGMTNVAVGDYCTFDAGQQLNTVSGKAVYDMNADGCTPSDIAYPFFRTQVKRGANISYFYANEQGDYNLKLDSLAYYVTGLLQNANYFTVSPGTTKIDFPNNNGTLVHEYCITTNGTPKNDVEIVLYPLSPAIPGFDANYKLLFHNKGTTTLSGTITLDFMGNKMAFVSASTATNSQTSNQLTWNYTNLLPFETRTIDITMNILPPPTNAIGDSVDFQATISPVIGDASSSDNVLVVPQILVGSFDPNDKTCLEGEYLSPTKIGKYLHYLVRFQNTGNYPAQRVVVVDSINTSQFDITSLQILETSHPAKVKAENKILQFHFENIQLPDSFSNEPASHGYVLFKIKTKSTLPVGTTVNNRAAIYFDYNLPVITNTASTTFSNTVGISAAEFPQFQLYPNPAQSELTIESANPLEIEMLNALGETVMEKNILGVEKIDIRDLPSGVYWVKDAKNNLGRAFIKE